MYMCKSARVHIYMYICIGKNKYNIHSDRELLNVKCTYLIVLYTYLKDKCMSTIRDRSNEHCVQHLVIRITLSRANVDDFPL